MSQENVEVVRRIYDDFLGRGMLPLDLTHPEVRIDNIPQSPIPGPYFGHQGARQWWADLEEAAPGLRLNAEEVMTLGRTASSGFFGSTSHGLAWWIRCRPGRQSTGSGTDCSSESPVT
jgi:hypothetical protein